MRRRRSAGKGRRRRQPRRQRRKHRRLKRKQLPATMPDRRRACHRLLRLKACQSEFVLLLRVLAVVLGELFCDVFSLFTVLAQACPLKFWSSKHVRCTAYIRHQLDVSPHSCCPGQLGRVLMHLMTRRRSPPGACRQSCRSSRATPLTARGCSPSARGSKLLARSESHPSRGELQ